MPAEHGAWILYPLSRGAVYHQKRTPVVQKYALYVPTRRNKGTPRSGNEVLPPQVVRDILIKRPEMAFILRVSPSGKASASQADTRGFESRCPLQRLFNPVSQGAGFFMRGQRAGRIGRAGMLYQGYKIDSNARGGA